MAKSDFLSYLLLPKKSESQSEAERIKFTREIISKLADGLVNSVLLSDLKLCLHNLNKYSKEDLPLVAEIASAQIFSAFSKQLRDAVDLDTELMTTLLTLIDKIYVRWMKTLGETKNIELLKLGEKYSTEIVEIDNFIEIIVNDLFELEDWIIKLHCIKLLKNISFFASDGFFACIKQSQRFFEFIIKLLKVKVINDEQIETLNLIHTTFKYIQHETLASSYVNSGLIQVLQNLLKIVEDDDKEKNNIYNTISTIFVHLLDSGDSAVHLANESQFFQTALEFVKIQLPVSGFNAFLGNCTQCLAHYIESTEINKSQPFLDEIYDFYAIELQLDCNQFLDKKLFLINTLKLLDKLITTKSIKNKDKVKKLITFLTNQVDNEKFVKNEKFLLETRQLILNSFKHFHSAIFSQIQSNLLEYISNFEKSENNKKMQIFSIKCEIFMELIMQNDRKHSNLNTFQEFAKNIINKIILKPIDIIHEEILLKILIILILRAENQTIDELIFDENFTDYIIPALKNTDDPPEQSINCQPLLILISLVLVDLFGGMKISKDLIEIFENIPIELLAKRLENLCHPNSIESKSKMSTFKNFETAIKPKLYYYLHKLLSGQKFWLENTPKTTAENKDTDNLLRTCGPQCENFENYNSLAQKFDALSKSYASLYQFSDRLQKSISLNNNVNTHAQSQIYHVNHQTELNKTQNLPQVPQNRFSNQNREFLPQNQIHYHNDKNINSNDFYSNNLNLKNDAISAESYFKFASQQMNSQNNFF